MQPRFFLKPANAQTTIFIEYDGLEADRLLMESI